VSMKCAGGDEVAEGREDRLSVGKHMNLSIAELAGKEDEPADRGDAENRLKAKAVRGHEKRFLNHAADSLLWNHPVGRLVLQDPWPTDARPTPLFR